MEIDLKKLKKYKSRRGSGRKRELRGGGRRKQQEAIEVAEWKGSWSKESLGGGRRKQQEAKEVKVCKGSWLKGSCQAVAGEEGRMSGRMEDGGWRMDGECEAGGRREWDFL